MRANGALRVGPDSVGYELTTRGLVFGGDTLTTTDVAVAAGYVDVGEPGRVAGLDKDLVNRTLDVIQQSVDVAVDRMKTSAAALPVILVGGGSILIGRPIQGASEVIKPEHFAVANALGAAIAQIGGEVDRVCSLENLTRDKALENQTRGGAQGHRRGRSCSKCARGRRRRGSPDLLSEQCATHTDQGRRRPRAVGTTPGRLMRLIYPENLEDIALGAAVLGGGGGSDPYVAKLIGMDALRTCGPVQLVLPDEISDDCLVAASAMIGAPTVIVEKLPLGTEVVDPSQMKKAMHRSSMR